MKLILNDCLLALKEMPDNSVDSVVTDPPYGLSFMGKTWDYDVPKVEVWSEVLRVLKPGGYLLSFAGSRTYHRMAVNIEDAGFEIRDMIEWVYGSGFPKSLNIGKAYDKKMGNEREITGSTITKDIRRNVAKDIELGKTDRQGKFAPGSPTQYMEHITTKGSSPYEGWGTALKPAHEPIVMARKPLIGTVVENVIAYGTGGINIDGCRVGFDMNNPEDVHAVKQWEMQSKSGVKVFNQEGTAKLQDFSQKAPTGRFPANLIHDGSDEVLEVFPDSKTSRIERPSACRVDGITSFDHMRGQRPARGYDGDGSAARFFYCAKASKSERNAGLEGFEGKFAPTMNNGIGVKEHDPLTATKKQNFHPTVKPIALMQYLVRLVTPTNGAVLDPFMGSGTTGIAAKREGFSFIGIEREPEYVEIAKARINSACQKKQLLLM